MSQEVNSTRLPWKCSSVQQAHFLDFTYMAPNGYVFAVSKWCGLYLQWELPMRVKISRGLSVCSTYGPEVVCLCSRAYEMLRKDIFPFTCTRSGVGEILIYCMKLSCHWHHLLLTYPPQALLMGPLLSHSCNALATFSDGLKTVRGKFDGTVSLFQLAGITSALLFS